MVDHPVLTDPDLSVPITLLRFNGGTVETRGVVSTLDEKRADVEEEFKDAGAQAWVAGHHEPEEIEFVIAAGRRYRALGGATLAGAGWQSTRLALINI